MARCGCGGSCGCTILQGDNIAVSGSGSAADPYIIDYDPGEDDSTTVQTVNGIVGPNVALGAEDVGANLPLSLSGTLSAGANIAIGTIQPLNAANGGFTVVLPLLSDIDGQLGRRIILEKAVSVDTTRNPIVVQTTSPNAFRSGATTYSIDRPGEVLELQAVGVGGSRAWKIVRATISKVGADLMYATADQTPSLEELERSVNFTVAAAAQTEAIGSANFDHRVGGFNLQFANAVATSDTNYWTAQLYRYRGTDTPQLLATKTTRVSGGEAIVAYNGWRFDNVVWPETQRFLRKGDGLVLVLTPTGSPAALGKTVATVRFESNVVPAVRDSFNRDDSNTSLGVPDSGGVYTTHIGTLGIKGSAMQAVALGNDGVSSVRAIASTPAPSSSGTVSAKLVGNPNLGGIGIRGRKNGTGATSTTSGFIHDASNVYRLDASSSTNVGSFSTAFAAGDTISWNVSGDTHTIYRNGVQVLQFTDSTYNTEKGILLRASTSPSLGIPLVDDLAWAA